MVLAAVLLASKGAGAVPALDTTTCPSGTTTTVSGANASTTNLVVSASAGFTINTTVLVTALTSWHTVTAVPDGTHITISPATGSTVTTGSVTGACPLEKFAVGGVYTGGSATQNFPVPVKCSAGGTHLIAFSFDEIHGLGTTTGAPVISPGSSANYSTQWALVVGSNSVTSAVASLDGGFSIYHAICTANDTPKVTVTCTGGTNVCATGTAAGLMETVVHVLGFTPASTFATLGNVGTNHAASGGTPSITLTTSSGDKLVGGWTDDTGANCTQAVSAGAALFDVAEIAGPLNVGCNAGSDDYYPLLWTSGSTSAGSTTIGVTNSPNITGVWGAVEVCSASASSCPDAVATVVFNWMSMGVGN